MDNYYQEHDHTANIAGGFFAGLLVGGLVGAVTMLLLAPQSGKKTRTQIQKKSIELRDQTSDAMEAAVNQAGVKARQIRDSVRTQTEELGQRGQAMFDAQKKRWAPLVEDGKKAVQGS